MFDFLRITWNAVLKKSNGAEFQCCNTSKLGRKFSHQCSSDLKMQNQLFWILGIAQSKDGFVRGGVAATHKFIPPISNPEF
jgi:hypothetical protein